jgi:hypothetical protein
MSNVVFLTTPPWQARANYTFVILARGADRREIPARGAQRAILAEGPRPTDRRCEVQGPEPELPCPAWFGQAVGKFPELWVRARPPLTREPEVAAENASNHPINQR